MSASEYKVEHKYRYEERLAILEAGPEPTAAQHNMAVAEANAHIAALKLQERKDALASLSELKNSL